MISAAVEDDAPRVVDAGADSHTDTPRWRRAHPLWVLFFAFCTAVTISMAAPIRPELLIDLACIAEPPSSPSNMSTATDTWTTGPYSAAVFTTKAPSPFPDIDTERCKHDVGVQKLTAHIQMGIKLIGGLLSVITIGYWATLSDTAGRLRIMAVCEFGGLVSEAAFLVVIYCPWLMAYAGVSVLFVGPFVEGLLGSFPAASAAMSAYITDTASEGSRFAYFSAINGVLMVGSMVGPQLGSLLVKVTDDSLMPLKVSLLVHALSILALLLVMPESLSAEARQRNRKRAQAAREADKLRRALLIQEEQARGSSHSTPAAAAVRSATRWLVMPIEALRVFVPKARNPDHPSLGKDWNLLLVALATFVISMTTGIADPKMQYIMYAFGWGRAQLAPLMTLTAACRFTALMVVSPLLARYVKPYFLKGENGPAADEAGQELPLEPATERTPLLSQRTADTAFDNDCCASDGLVAAPTIRHSAGNLAFDRALLSACFIIEVISYASIGANARANTTVFIVSTVFHSLAAPASPCASALALQVADKHLDAGRLFGALGIIDALSSTLLSPLLYTVVFSTTIAWYPPAIFIVAAISFTVALVGAALVRMPSSD